MINTYMGSNEELRQENIKARKFVLEYNNLDPADTKLHFEYLKRFLGDIGEGTRILAPFHCDRGNKIHIGKKSFINYGATILDMTDVYIGDDVRIAPNVSIYTVWHPLNWKERMDRVCYTDEVYIGDHTWICGDVTILPGVKIGKRCVIGAGSVVTHDIPDDSLAYGNPCQVIRKLEENENE
jgi:acetyltransferase-like isoleucine patch superfamily enzyme